MKQLTKKEILICEEYIVNGFHKTNAYASQHPNTKNINSLRTEATKFFKKEHIKEYLEERTAEAVEKAKTLTNMLLINLQYDAFERNIDADFGWKEKQNAQKLMIATIEKLANKSTNETSNKTITISLLDD